jgi:hypothetical protein
MAEARQELSILQDGMTLNTPIHKSVWIQNFYRNQAQNWETRDGFGVIAEIGSSMTAKERTVSTRTSTTETVDAGLQTLLGAYLIHTTFGHDQLVSVFLSRGNLSGDPSQVNKYISNDYDYFYSVVIYDVTTNNHYEQILYTHTSEFETQSAYGETQITNNSYNHGYYEARTSGAKKFHTIKEANNAENEVWFAEFQDRVYFGSTDLPTFVYEPSIFRTPRGKFIHNILQQTEVNDQESNPYSEESLVFPLALKDGQFTEAYTYIQQAQIPNFSSATYIANRMVYAAGKTLYFSDPNQPNAIIGQETYTLDLEDDIVAIRAWNNNIMVWSTFETAVYQPSLNSSLLSGGTHVILSHKIGILNNACFCTTDDGIYWANGVGIYFTGNCFDKQEVSTSIGLFFTDYAVNPLMYYYNQTGGVNTTTVDDSPQYTYKLFEGNNTKFAHMVFDPQYRQIIFCVPKLNLAWVLNKGWYLWNFESSVKYTNLDPAVARVGVTNNLDQPRLLIRDANIYAIAGKKTYTSYEPYYASNTNILDYHTATYNTSFSVCEWKRGGALDRNTIGTYLEDWKYSAGYVNLESFVPTSGKEVRIFFDKLIPKRGKLWRDTAAIPEIGIDERVFLLPIRFTPNYQDGTDLYTNIYTFQLVFRVDFNNWEVISDSSGNIPAILPTERVYAKQGFGILSPTASEQVTVNGTGVVTIKFNWGAVTNPTWNGMAVNCHNKNNIIYIPVRARDTSSLTRPTNTVVYKVDSFTTDMILGSHIETINGYRAIIWQNGWVQYNTEEQDSQYVDWVFKSAQFGIDDQPQIKARGTYATLTSRGSATNPLHPSTATFPYGLYNSIAGSDYKDYVSQTIDVGGLSSTQVIGEDLTLITGKNTTRNRAINNAGILTKKNFDNGFTFGDVTSVNGAFGNYLVDAQEVDTISTSDSVRGEQVNYTLFGYLKNKAEKIILNSLTAVVFAVGGRRRRGR